MIIFAQILRMPHFALLTQRQFFSTNIALSLSQSLRTREQFASEKITVLHFIGVRDWSLLMPGTGAEGI